MKTYNIGWKNTKEGPKLKLLTDEGIKYSNFPFRPYFYVKEGGYQTEGFEKTVESVCRNFSMDFPDNGYVKIKVNTPKQVSILTEKLKQRNIKTYESDIPYSRRMQIDTDTGIDVPKNPIAFDIETDPRGEFSKAKDAEKQIISIATVDMKGEKNFFCEDDEVETLKKFLDYIDDYKVIYGWNSYTFDWPYLKNRIFKLDGIHFDPFSVAHADILPVYRDMLLEHPTNYRLGTVGKFEFGEDKAVDLEMEMEVQKLWDYYQNDREKLKRYNVQDAYLTQKLNEKYGLIKVIFGIMAHYGHTLPKFIQYQQQVPPYKTKMSTGNIVEGVLLQKSKEKGIVWPNKGDVGKKESYTGAVVFEPLPGRWKNVVTFDYSGMYPSIIRAFNIGPKTFCEGNEGDIKAPIGSFKKSPKSVFVDALDELEAVRYRYKNTKSSLERGSLKWQKFNAQDIVLKQTVNSFYGTTGSGYTRFYDKNIAENVTLIGQDLTKRAKIISEKAGHVGVGGDTDSIFVSMNLGEDKDIVEAAKEFGKKLNSEIKKYVKMVYNANPDPIAIDMDEVYSAFFITKAKKRHAGIIIYDNGPCFEYSKKGFESVRSDWPQASREFTDSLLKKVLLDKDQTEYILDMKEKVLNGELDDKLIQHKTLGQRLEDYEHEIPHTRAARMIKEDGEEVRVGDKIPYIKYGSRKTDVAACHNGLPDLNVQRRAFIWKKYFKSIMERLGVGLYKQTKIEEHND